MQRGRRAGLLLSFLLGILNSTQSVNALDVVSYTPGKPFRFNPISGNPNQDFGTVTIQSDNPTGWVLRVRSNNQGAFRHSGSVYTIQYSLTVDGTVVDLSDAEATAKVSTTSLCYEPGGCSYSLQGTMTAAEIDGKPAGSYTDTLTFTLINQ